MTKKQIGLLMNTVKYLKPVQVYFRVFYATRTYFRKKTSFSYPLSLSTESYRLKLDESIFSLNSYERKTFTFLNVSKTFGERIEWNYSEYGKLWTYNLTYFDYLNQISMSKNRGLDLISDFIVHSATIKDGFEPFPISLRTVNWIKFLSKYDVCEKEINDSLFAQYKILLDNLEYHLLGNHLLENAFSLLFGAYYFHEEQFYQKAKHILTKELNEQVLEDGAHFELSPMYHQIMLYRVLECINLLKYNAWKDNALLELLEDKASLMLGWLNVITFNNGDIPLFNDSCNKIAPRTNELNTYAKRLKVSARIVKLGKSGYRKYVNEWYECIVDIGNIGPDYIPGHAHSDTFSFELYINGKPCIVDTGISTYESNEERTFERSTVSHNTVEIENSEQSQVWGGFRVADRAYVIDIDETDNVITALHDGYKKRYGVFHQRKFIFAEKTIKIIDDIEGKNSVRAIARIHFHPDLVPVIENNRILVNEFEMTFSSADLSIQTYAYASEFNKKNEAKVLEIKFQTRLEMELQL